VHIVGVCGVISDPGGSHILLIRTPTAGWELPGGRVEAGEDLHTALCREVREETGYALQTIGRLAGVYAHTRSDTLLLVFTATASSVNAPANDPDVLEMAWFTPDRALQAITHPSEHDRLADALREPGQPAYRVY
jgi:8-oxo-dGTP diphosphatase